MSGGDATARYVFGVAGRDADLPVVDPTPLGSHLELCSLDDLTALTAPIRRDELTGPHTEEPAWIVPRADAHDRVLTAWALTSAVVPYRFGAVFDDSAAVRDHLRARADRLHRALAAVDGAVEYAVTLRSDPHAARAAGRRGSGRDYLRARGRQLAGTDLERAHDLVDAALGRLGARAIPMPGRPQEVRLACLIPRRHAREAVDALESEQPAGVAVAVSGPHPAYHFAGSADVAS